MNTTKIRSSLSLVILLGATIASLAACGTEVVGGGGQGGGGQGGSTASAGDGGNGGGGVGGANAGTPNAIAMLYSELSSPNATGTTVASSGTGGGPGPDTLYIAVASDGQLCNDPFKAEPCGDQWRVSFGIPVELQKVGVISLSDPSIISNFSMSGPIDPSGICSGGGGSFLDGTLEITAIDGNHVAGVLSNTPTFDFDANGAFDAVRCQF